MRDALLGRRLGGDREFLIVVQTLIGIAQYAAGMIDEAKRFFDIALPVARFCVIFSNQTAKRCPHLLVGGTLRYTQRFVQRCFHALPRAKRSPNYDLEYSGKWRLNASWAPARRITPDEAGAGRHTVPFYVTSRLAKKSTFIPLACDSRPRTTLTKKSGPQAALDATARSNRYVPFLTS